MTSQVQSKAFFVAAAGTTYLTTMANGQPALYVSGTFVGTVQLCANPAGGGGTPQPLTPTGTTTPNITAPGVYVFGFMAGDFDYSIVCSAYTSGTVTGQLNVGPRL